MEITKNRKLKLDMKMFILGVFLKQFYILPSGSLQLGDICLFMSFVIHFVPNNSIKVRNEETNLKRFVLFVVFVNGIYFLIYQSSAFLMSAFYYVFNFFIVLLFVELMCDKTFLVKLELVLKLNLVIQLAIYLSGRGRYYYDRYTGTFNDPNQYGFFIFSTFLLISIIDSIENRMKKSIIWYIFSLLLMSPSASTGMILGFGAFIILFIIFSANLNMNGIIKWFAIVFLFATIYVLLNKEIIKLPSVVYNSNIYQRLMVKVNNVSDSSENMIEDRAWNKVLMYPDRLFYGAGEGYFQRFNGSGSEIHSSILAPLWYYGIIPCTFWFSWCYKKLKGIKKELLCVYLSLIIESITLVHNRQPFFWMIFVLAGHTLNKRITYQKDNQYDFQNADMLR